MGVISNQDTIVGVATPAGEGGIAVVRMSGPKAPVILETLFSCRTPVPRWESHRLVLGRVKDLEGELVDEALAVWMKAPATYTREDVVELHLHGSPALTATVVDGCVAAGARLAGPGEFTLRAFLNGRLSLAQAESVQRLVAARSQEEVRLAAAGLVGRLARCVEELRRELLDWLVRLEAELDFGDEVEGMPWAESCRRLDRARSEVARLRAGCEAGRLVGDGLRVALLGPPNAGKSSLLNSLLGEDRALVSPHPGTTRDRIEEVCRLRGVTLRLVDTAGIRSARDPVEALGVEGSLWVAGQSQLTVLVLDGSEPYPEGDWARLLAPTALLVVNKRDLGEVLSLTEVRRRLPGHPVVAMSVKTGQGREDLEATLAEVAWKAAGGRPAQVFSASARQREALARTGECLERAGKTLQAGLSAEFLCLDLRPAVEELGQILGLNVTEEVLDGIFSAFCLGK